MTMGNYSYIYWGILDLIYIINFDRLCYFVWYGILYMGYVGYGILVIQRSIYII